MNIRRNIVIWYCIKLQKKKGFIKIVCSMMALKKCHLIIFFIFGMYINSLQNTTDNYSNCYIEKGLK